MAVQVLEPRITEWRIFDPIQRSISPLNLKEQALPSDTKEIRRLDFVIKPQFQISWFFECPSPSLQT